MAKNSAEQIMADIAELERRKRNAPEEYHATLDRWISEYKKELAE